MKSTELRIGNIVYRNDIRKNEIYTIFSGGELDSSGIFTPVRLTDEWIKKLGYEKDGAEMFAVYGKENSQNIVKCDDGYYFIDNEQGGINDIPMKYVHQLQNLYFALKGEELKYSAKGSK
mgnify:CR=1 FL=1